MQRRGDWLRRAASFALLVAPLAMGCQRADRYQGRLTPASKPGPVAETPKRSTPAPPDTPRPLDPRLQWEEPSPTRLENDIPIEFIHADTSPEEWKKLPHYWNAPALTQVDQAAALLGMPPLTSGTLAAGQAGQVVKIKVPLGLDDPRSYVPDSNPPRLGQWLLGKRLFFDKSYLNKSSPESCASCHVPGRGFTDNLKNPLGYHTPTLINCVYTGNLFWDGRAGRLEEVVQRTLEDEREPTTRPAFRHTWGGVIERLRDNESYRWQFSQVYGTPPTQDAVGRALATYLRTLLAGNSLHDRAKQAQAEARAPALEPKHYETVLDDAALQQLGRKGRPKMDVAAELHQGYRLFYNLGDRKANCIACHSGRQYTDNHFHNLGVSWKSETYRPNSGQETGRFTSVPIGQKSARLIAAFKTPSLRNLSRTQPYFHDGSVDTLREVVEFYNRGGAWNQFVDPEMLDPKDLLQPRQLGLTPEDIEALILFLRALDGEDVDPFVKTPPPPK
jgi:cytochrome c peroxidase